MEQYGEITARIRQMLDEEEYKYDTSKDGNIFVLGFNLDSSLSSVRCFLSETNLGFTVVAIIPLRGDTNNPKLMRDIAELMSRINYGIRLLTFSMDFSDGEIRCEVDYPCGEGVIPSTQTIHTIMSLTTKTWERFAPCFLSVIFGGKSPEEAYKEALPE